MTDETPRERLSDRILREHAAPRRRVVDEAMFAPGEPYPRTTFRVQVFTAPGVRPVALATQEPWYEGCSLINGAERFVAAVWRRYLSQEADPPLWIQHVILESKDDGCRLVDFTVTGRYQLTRPRWSSRLSAQDLQQLVGAPGDIARGPYQRRARALEPRPVLAPMPVRHLPRPQADADRACRAAGISWWTVQARQLRPRHTGAAHCCWYHGGNWHEVCRQGLVLLHQAHTENIPDEEIPRYIVDQAEITGLRGWALQALESLVFDPIAMDEDGDFLNGRHRSQALLEPGVRHPLVGRYLLPDL